MFDTDLEDQYDNEKIERKRIYAENRFIDILIRWFCFILFLLCVLTYCCSCTFYEAPRQPASNIYLFGITHDDMIKINEQRNENAID